MPTAIRFYVDASCTNYKLYPHSGMSDLLREKKTEEKKTVLFRQWARLKGQVFFRGKGKKKGGGGGGNSCLLQPKLFLALLFKSETTT